MVANNTTTGSFGMSFWQQLLVTAQHVPELLPSHLPDQLQCALNDSQNATPAEVDITPLTRDLLAALPPIDPEMTVPDEFILDLQSLKVADDPEWVATNRKYISIQKLLEFRECSDRARSFYALFSAERKLFTLQQSLQILQCCTDALEAAQRFLQSQPVNASYLGEVHEEINDFLDISHSLIRILRASGGFPAAVPPEATELVLRLSRCLRDLNGMESIPVEQKLQIAKLTSLVTQLVLDLSTR